MTPQEFEAAFPKVMTWIQQTLVSHKALARSVAAGVRNAVGILGGAISGNMKVSFQAARSIG